MRMYFDGGSRGNGGASGCAAVLKDETTGAVVAFSYRGLGCCTNNVAEYEGLILGLMLIKDLRLPAARLLSIRGDSSLVVNQVSGEWAVRDAGMAALHAQALALLAELGVGRKCIEHVYREHNAEADEYANLAIDTQAGLSFREERYFPGHRGGGSGGGGGGGGGGGDGGDEDAAAAAAAAADAADAAGRGSSSSSSGSSSNSAAVSAEAAPAASARGAGLAAAAEAAIAATMAGGSAEPLAGRRRRHDDGGSAAAAASSASAEAAPPAQRARRS
jgi:probable phosphoglycerate mutase